MAEKVTAYRDRDGKIHETRISAERKDLELNIEEQLSQDPLFGGDGKVEAVDLIDWIKGHRNTLRDYLEHLE